MRTILMKQRVIQICFAVLLMTATAVAVGQSASAKSEAEKGREMIREARLAIVHSELQLSDEEATAFWPMYTAYRAETDLIQDRYAAMVADYMRRYDNADLTDEYADELMANYFAIKRELLDVQTKFLPEFRNVLPALKVAQLFQLENKISAEIDAQLALAVPLVDPS